MLPPDNIEIICAILFGMVFKLYDDLKDGGFVRPGLLTSAIYLAIGFLVAIISLMTLSLLLRCIHWN
jgi:multisubunit Na+/H+ antiporter MnhB subunit